MSYRPNHVIAATLSGLLAAACGGSDAPTAPPAGFTIQASVTTTGVHRDADGYTVSLDGGSPRLAASNGKVSFAGVSAGAHKLTLADVTANCSVADGLERTVNVTSAGATTAFAVSCTEVPLGLVFASNRAANAIELWNMKADGSAPIVRVLDGDAFLISVAPNASRIAFTSPRAGNPEVFVVNSDGSGLRNISQHSGTDVSPAFSPDGSRIAFMSNRDGNADIFVVDVDGSGVTNLTRSAEFENEPHWCNGRIVYTRSGATPGADIFTMNADGSDVRRITNDGATVNTPRWSPDCSRIGFSSTRHAGAAADPRRDLDLYVINADGSNLQRLTSTPGFDITPAWSPDGARLAFATERDGNSEIYVMNADGSAPVNRTRHGANDQSPVWVR